MKRSFVALALFVLVFLAGCGAKEKPADDSSATTTPAGESGTISTSVPNPDGIIAKDISVPDVVLTAAESYVKQEYNYWCKNSGAIEIVDGKAQMVGEPAIYDNWKIEQIELCYHYDNLEGRNLDLYRLHYRIHTTTPEKVMLAGAMEIDPDGWLLTFCQDGTYLVVSLDEAEKTTYLFPFLSTDSEPGNELFTSDLIRALQVKSPEAAS